MIISVRQLFFSNLLSMHNRFSTEVAELIRLISTISDHSKVTSHGLKPSVPTTLSVLNWDSEILLIWNL